MLFCVSQSPVYLFSPLAGSACLNSCKGLVPLSPTGLSPLLLSVGDTFAKGSAQLSPTRLPPLLVQAPKSQALPLVIFRYLYFQVITQQTFRLGLQSSRDSLPSIQALYQVLYRSRFRSSSPRYRSSSWSCNPLLS